MSDPVSPLLAGHLERSSFEAGDPLTAAALNLEHQYRVQVLRHHLRLLHGWGVVCGLSVVSLHDGIHPWKIRVCPGYGVNPCGDEILVPQALDYDLARMEWQREVTGSHRDILYIGLRLGERPSRPIPVEGCACGCNCNCQDVRPSRSRDIVEVVAVWTIHANSNPKFDLCSGDVPPCVPCPPTCDLVLASVALPKSTSEMIENGDIDNSIGNKL